MSAQMHQGIEHVCNSARSRGLEFDVLAVERKTTAISFQKRKLDQFSFSETRQLGVRVFDGKHEGVAYTENLETSALNQMLDQAVANARWIERDFLSTLPSSQSFNEIKGLCDSSLAITSSEQKLKAAALLESAALDHDPRITSVAYTRYSDHDSQVWIANSRGLNGSYRTVSAMGYSHCLATDPNGNAMAGEAEMHRRFGDLDPNRIAKSAAEKTLQRLGAIRPKTGRYTVVIENRAVEQLMAAITDYFNAKSVDEKSSALAGKLGQKVFASCIHLTDDPTYVSAPGCRPFDEEGYPCQKTTLVQDGRVENFLTNSALAKKMKLKHTCSASRAPSTDLDAGASTILLQPGRHDFAQLMNADNTVILITDLMGMAGFRAASGDFSIPVQGFQYEQGHQKVALKDFLISGNILEFLNTVEAVGNDVLPPVGSLICPSLLIRNVNISGQA